jgi:hypothetical protein
VAHPWTKRDDSEATAARQRRDSGRQRPSAGGVPGGQEFLPMRLVRPATHAQEFHTPTPLMYFSCQIEDAEGVVSENGKNNTLSQWNLWNGWMYRFRAYGD